MSHIQHIYSSVHDDSLLFELLHDDSLLFELGLKEEKASLFKQ